MYIIRKEWPRVAIEGVYYEKYAVKGPQKLPPYGGVTDSDVTAGIIVAVLLLFIQLFYQYSKSYSLQLYPADAIYNILSKKQRNK